jgi:DNA (cytosine-5)-methyltransferase 1
MSAYYNEHDPYAAKWLRNLIDAGEIAPGVVDERDIQQLTEGDLAGFTQVHLFAGVGGWSLALRLAGWPDDRPVWSGSCPCQPYSFAGKQLGHADDRNLWPHMLRLIRVCRPATCFGEQVASAIGHGWLDGVSLDLEDEGYAVGAAVLPASAADAPHRRDRLWFVAHPERDEQPWQEPRCGTDGRVGRERQLLPWDGGWPAALARFRAVGDGFPRCVAGTDAARNAIVPQIAAEFIAAYREVTEAA